MSGKQPKRNDRPGVDRAGRTPLHFAALDGDSGRVRQLDSAQTKCLPVLCFGLMNEEHRSVTATTELGIWQVIGTALSIERLITEEMRL
jgi:hypothetical protein